MKPQRVADTEPQTTQKSPIAEDSSVVRHEERPTVDKETDAAEKIKIGKETTQDTQTVSGKVAKEQIDIDQAKQPKNK